MLRPIQLGDLVRRSVRAHLDLDQLRAGPGGQAQRRARGMKGIGLVVGFDTKHGTASIQVRWPSTGRTDWASCWQLEVLSEVAA